MGSYARRRFLIWSVSGSYFHVPNIARPNVASCLVVFRRASEGRRVADGVQLRGRYSYVFARYVSRNEKLCGNGAVPGPQIVEVCFRVVSCDHHRSQAVALYTCKHRHPSSTTQEPHKGDLARQAGMSDSPGASNPPRPSRSTACDTQKSRQRALWGGGRRCHWLGRPFTK